MFDMKNDKILLEVCMQKILSEMRKAIEKFGLIENGDKIRKRLYSLAYKVGKHSYVRKDI